MTQQVPRTVFSRVDPTVLRGASDSTTKKDSKAEDSTAEASKGTAHPKRPRRKRPRLRRWAKLVAPVVWLLFIVDTAIISLDGLAVRLLPGLGPLLQYRLLLVTVALVLVVTFSRSRAFYTSILYVIFYPAILLGWVVPRFVWMHKSWTATIGLSHVLLGMMGGFRRGVYLWTLIIFCVVLVLTDATWTNVAALLIACALVLWSTWSMIVQALKPDRFLTMQAKIFKWWTSDPDRFTIPDEVAKSRSNKLNEQQSNMVVDRAAVAAVTYYGGRFWADRLENYTKSKAFFIFGAIAVLRYFALFVLYLTLASAALYQLDPSQYQVEGDPSWITFLQFSFASMTSGDVYGFAAQGDVARLIATVASFLGIAAIPFLGVTLWQGYRYSTSSGSGDAPIAAIRRESDKVAELANAAFLMPITKVAEELLAFNSTVFNLLVALSQVSDLDFGFPNEAWIRAERARTQGKKPGGANPQQRPGRGRRGRSRARRERH